MGLGFLEDCWLLVFSDAIPQMAVLWYNSELSAWWSLVAVIDVHWLPGIRPRSMCQLIYLSSSQLFFEGGVLKSFQVPWLIQIGKSNCDTCWHLIYLQRWCGWLINLVRQKLTGIFFRLLINYPLCLNVQRCVCIVGAFDKGNKMQIIRGSWWINTKYFLWLLRVQHNWKTWHVFWLKRKQVHQSDGILCGQEHIHSIFNDVEKCSWYVKWKKDMRL